MAQTTAPVEHVQQVCLHGLSYAFTPPQPLASGVIQGGHPHSVRHGGGTIPGQLQVAVPCLLSRQTTSVTEDYVYGVHLYT